MSHQSTYSDFGVRSLCACPNLSLALCQHPGIFYDIVEVFPDIPQFLWLELSENTKERVIPELISYFFTSPSYESDKNAVKVRNLSDTFQDRWQERHGGSYSLFR